MAWCQSLVAAVHGVAKSRTRLSDFTFTFHFYALEKEVATHSSILAWRIPGTGEPCGLSSMGSHRVGYNWSDLAAAVAAYNTKKHNSSMASKSYSPWCISSPCPPLGIREDLWIQRDSIPVIRLWINNFELSKCGNQWVFKSGWAFPERESFKAIDVLLLAWRNNLPCYEKAMWLGPESIPWPSDSQKT